MNPKSQQNSMSMIPCLFSLFSRVTGMMNSDNISIETTHLKGEKRHDYGHPADCHGDVSSPLLGDDVDGAEEEYRPNDVVEDNKAQEGHQDPQWNTHHLRDTDTGRSQQAIIQQQQCSFGSNINVLCEKCECWASVWLTSQGQLMILSSLRAMNMNCRIFTEHNTSS